MGISFFFLVRNRLVQAFRMPSPLLPQSPLDERDVREIVRLLGEVIATAGGIDAKRRVLLE